MFSLCGTCRSEKIFVANRLRVHTALVLSATKIGTIPNPQKKLSDFGMHFAKCEQHKTEQGSGETTTSFPANLYAISGRQRIALGSRLEKLNTFQKKSYFLMCPIKIIFSSVILVISYIVDILFSLQLMLC